MKISKLFKPLAFVLAGFLFAGCATTSPVDSQARKLCVQTFGTDAYLRVLWLPTSYVDQFFTKVLADNSTPGEIAYSMTSGRDKRVDFVVWTEPHSFATSSFDSAFRFIPESEQLTNLNVLYVGDAQDGDYLRPEIEAKGAKFYFHQR